nr:hypothetical protein [uncultured Aquabacterium sp.]
MGSPKSTGLKAEKRPREEALINLITGAGKTYVQIEEWLSIGREKSSKSGNGKTGERGRAYQSGTSGLRRNRHLRLAEIVCELKLTPVSDEHNLWQLDKHLQVALGPALLIESLCQIKGCVPQDTRAEVRALQSSLDKKRNRDTQLLWQEVLPRLVDRIRALCKALTKFEGWTIEHPVTGDTREDFAQLDLAGAGMSFFVYRTIDLPAHLIKVSSVQTWQPVLFDVESPSPKDACTVLLRNLESSLELIRFDEVASQTSHAASVLEQAQGVKRAVKAMMDFAHQDRSITWTVSHPICMLGSDDQKVTIKQAPILSWNDALGRPVHAFPEIDAPQPTIYGPQHSSHQSRYLRYLDLMVEVVRTIKTDRMVDIGADLVGSNSYKCLALLNRHFS